MKSKGPHIRRALLTDVSALKSCIDAAYTKYSSRISDMSAVSDGIDEDIINNRVWLVEIGGEIVAGLFLVAREYYMNVANLAVHPHHSGKGIGRLLLQHSENEARKQGYVEMRLNTHVAMPENVALYKHLGWEEISRIEITISMRKTLRNT